MRRCGQYRGGQYKLDMMRAAMLLNIYWYEYTKISILMMAPKPIRQFCCIPKSMLNAQHTYLTVLLAEPHAKQYIISFHRFTCSHPAKGEKQTDGVPSACVRAAEKPSLIFNQWWIKQQFYFQTRKKPHMHTQTWFLSFPSFSFFSFIDETRKKESDPEINLQYTLPQNSCK